MHQAVSFLLMKKVTLWKNFLRQETFTSQQNSEPPSFIGVPRCLPLLVTMIYGMIFGLKLGCSLMENLQIVISVAFIPPDLAQ